MSRRYNVTPIQMLFTVAFIILIGIGLLFFQAWLLGVVLGWFGVSLAFWKNLVIVLLISMLFGGTKVSSK